MSPLTLFLGKFFGVSCLIMCAVLALRPGQTSAAINSIMESPGLLLMTGVVTVFGGTAIVVGHNVWSGGALPVTVTVLGWVTLIKGIALMVMPPRSLTAFYRVLRYPARLRLYMTAAIAFSAWLTVTAFLA